MKTIYKIFFFSSVALTIIALIVTVVVWRKTGGSILSAEFRGGSVLEISFSGERPQVADIQEKLRLVEGVGSLTITPSESDRIIIRSNSIDTTTHQAILSNLQESYSGITEERFSDIGPTVGKELKTKSVRALIILILVILIYIAIVFRKMARVLSPWAMGLAAVLALIHDIVIPVGIFSLLGMYFGVEITAVFVAAALTILGYSISDTVVVFDRIRENVILLGSKETFSDLVHNSVLQTLTRSINTSLTTILTLLAIFFFGGETIKYFALAMTIGVAVGTYSSIFIASPVIMWWHGRRKI